MGDVVVAVSDDGCFCYGIIRLNDKHPNFKMPNQLKAGLEGNMNELVIFIYNERKKIQKIFNFIKF